MGKIPISILINTFNEERNIRNCLESVKWADDIVIVDMYSDDKTVEIAKKYTHRIFFFERCGYADPARQFALEQAKYDWCLIVDADEIVPYKMFLRIKHIIENDLADIVYLPRNNYFFGILLQGNGWAPLQDVLPRLFKKQFVELTPAVHSIFKIKGNPRKLLVENPEEGFIHFGYIDVEHFIDKLNRYTTIEAKNMFEGLKQRPKSFWKEFSSIIKEVRRRFISKRGYKDGIIGLYLAMLMGCYKVASYLKLRIMHLYNTSNPREQILKKYDEIAESFLKEYKTEIEK